MIYINDNFRISADAYNFILEEYRKTDPKNKDIEAKYKWVHLGFYTTLEGTMIGLFRHLTKQVDKDNLQDFLFELKDIEKRIRASVKHIQVIERKEDQRGKHLRKEKDDE